MATTTGITFVHNFLVGNYNLSVPGSNVLSVTSTATGDFDKKNLTSTPLRETWRSATATGWQEIVIAADFTTAAPDIFAILNHNFTSSVVVQLQASMTSDFTSPAVTVNITYNPKHMILQQNLGVAYAYYKLRILDPTNTCGYVEIGRFLAGQSLVIGNDEDITEDYTVSPDDLAYATKTEGFFRAFNERVKVDLVEVSFEKIQTVTPSNTNFLNLKSMIYDVGLTYPFLTILDPADPTFQLTWGQLKTMPSFTYTVNRYASIKLQIQEVY